MERLEKALRKALNTPDGELLPLPPRSSPRAEAPVEAVPAPPRARQGTQTQGTPPGPRSPEAAAFWQGLQEVRPSLGALSRGLVVTTAEDPDAGHFELLGAKLLHRIRSQGWRRIGITAPSPGCGATTVALNLAFGLAQQAELRVLLVEADLARPSIAATLGLRPTAGLAELVGKKAEPARALLRLRTNLAAAIAPKPGRTTASLPSASSAGEAIERLEALLDPSVTLVDLPPLLGGAQAAQLAGLADGILLVAAAGTTTIPEVEACQRALSSQASLVGVVLNRCPNLGATQGPILAGQRRGWWGTEL